MLETTMQLRSIVRGDVYRLNDLQWTNAGVCLQSGRFEPFEGKPLGAAVYITETLSENHVKRLMLLKHPNILNSMFASNFDGKGWIFLEKPSSSLKAHLISLCNKLILRPEEIVDRVKTIFGDVGEALLEAHRYQLMPLSLDWNSIYFLKDPDNAKHNIKLGVMVPLACKWKELVTNLSGLIRCVVDLLDEKKLNSKFTCELREFSNFVLKQRSLKFCSFRNSAYLSTIIDKESDIFEVFDMFKIGRQISSEQDSIFELIQCNSWTKKVDQLLLKAMEGYSKKKTEQNQKQFSYSDSRKDFIRFLRNIFAYYYDIPAIYRKNIGTSKYDLVAHLINVFPYIFVGIKNLLDYF